MTGNGLTVSTITGDYVSAETWRDVPEMLLTELRTRLGEPTVRQLIPVDVLDRVNGDPAMVALEPDPEESP